MPLRFSSTQRILLAIFCFAIAIVGFMVKLPSVFRHIDKELHASFYFLAAAFLNVLFAKAKLWRHVLILVVLYLFGIAIEYSQAYSNQLLHARIHGRYDPEDVQWNLKGLLAFSAIWLCWWAAKHFYKQLGKPSEQAAAPASQEPTPQVADTRHQTPNNMTKQIFINLPVQDPEQSMAFYSALGFTNNPQFSDEQGKCMIWSDSIYLMLLSHQKFASFATKPIADTKAAIAGLYSLSLSSEDEVHTLMAKGLQAGGTEPHEPRNYGFMLQRTLVDFDGHTWELFYMDMSKIPAATAEM